MSEISWIHLSDMHINSSNSADQKKIFASLIDDVEDKIADFGISIDMVFFTGDVAQSASKKDYDLALNLLDNFCSKLKIDKDNFFIVPGNHDVDRMRVSKTLDEARKQLVKRKEISNIIKNSKLFNKYLERFSNYSNFINTFYGRSKKSGSYRKIDSNNYYYGETRSVGSVDIGIIGLNSSWADHGDRDDSNNIYISEDQLSNAINIVQDTKLKIVLMHHPLSWLYETDKVDMENLLYRHCHIILHGHIHSIDVQVLHTTRGDQIVIPAGAIFDGSRVKSCYNISTIDSVDETLRVLPRRFNERHYKYLKDVDAIGNDIDIEFKQKLPQKILDAIK